MLFKLVPIVALAWLVAASDSRKLYDKPDALSMEEFKAGFTYTCEDEANRVSDISLSSMLFRAGDFRGQNTDTQALAFCNYKNVNGGTIKFGDHIVESLGGKVHQD